MSWCILPVPGNLHRTVLWRNKNSPDQANLCPDKRFVFLVYWLVVAGTVLVAFASLQGVSSCSPLNSSLTSLCTDFRCIAKNDRYSLRLCGAVSCCCCCCYLLLLLLLLMKLLCCNLRGLTFTWWGCYGLCLWHKPTELAHPFYSVLVSISVFKALSTVFHSMNSPDNSPFSHSVLPVLSLPYWSFKLYISLWKSPSALIKSLVVS